MSEQIVKINLVGKTFSLKTEENPLIVKETARKLNEKVETFAKETGATLGDATIMTAMSIFDDYLKQQKEFAKEKCVNEITVKDLENQLSEQEVLLEKSKEVIRVQQNELRTRDETIKNLIRQLDQYADFAKEGANPLQTISELKEEIKTLREQVQFYEDAELNRKISCLDSKGYK